MVASPHDAPDPPRVPQPAAAQQLQGIDVSEYQGQIDWHAVKAGGMTFAAIKATEGLGFQDPRFSENWAGVRAAGLVRGAYHFFHASLDGAAQADYLHAYVRRHGHFIHGDFVLLDLEEVSIDGEPAVVVLQRARDFVGRARRETGRPVFLYTDVNTWRNLLGNPRDALLASCPLWLAEYGPAPERLDNWPAGVSFWQYSAAGRVPGVPADVDLDIFFGGLDQLHKLTAP